MPDASNMIFNKNTNANLLYISILCLKVHTAPLKKEIFPTIISYLRLYMVKVNALPSVEAAKSYLHFSSLTVIPQVWKDTRVSK